MPITFGGGNGDREYLRWEAKTNSLKARLEKLKRARQSGKPDLGGEKEFRADLNAFEKDLDKAEQKRLIAMIEKMEAIFPLFPTGRLVVTAGVDREMKENPAFSDWVGQCMQRHIHGDWGDMDPEDKKQNEGALKHGERLMSAYEQKPFPKIWIITEWDRSVTTVLFPEEY